MNTTTLQTKIENAEAKVEKTSKTIERHEKQLQKKLDFLASKGINVDLKDIDASRWINGERHEWSWEVAEVSMKLEDIRGAKKKHEEAKKIAMNWRIKLENEQNKENFLEANTPQVIKDFLEEWKILAYDWTVKKYKDSHALNDKLKSEAQEIRNEFILKNFKKEVEEYENNFSYSKQEAIDKIARYHGTSELNSILTEERLTQTIIRNRVANFAGATVLQMNTMRNEEERLAWLDKELNKEKIAKMLDLVTRINNVVGTITDAKGLYISNAGNINGFIVGTQGKASVETIGAGGYNIQRFHYRTLINKIK